jgi:hypothetical protein
MAKIYQVRYTVGDKTVAHEHYTEKGAKADSKQLSKVIGNAMLGEIDTNDEGVRTLSRVWEYTGGEMGKPIKREGPPSDVEVIKTVEDTKLSDVPVEKKPKAPRMTDEEKIAKIKEDAEEKLAAIAAGTYVLPVRGRKPAEEGGATATRKPKVEADKVSKLVETLKISDDTAKLIAAIGLNATSRRTKVAVLIMEANGPILASDIMKKLNETEESKFDMKEVVLFALHLNYLFSRENQPWKAVVQDKDSDKIIKLVSSPIETIEEPDTSVDDEQEPPTSEVA